MGKVVGKAGDLRWLERRGQGWYCVLDVPRPLRAVVGKKRLIKSLQTHDVHLARGRRHAVLAAFHQEIARARTSTQAPPVVAIGMEWRDALARVDQGDPDAVSAWRDGPAFLPDDVADQELARAAANVRDALAEAMGSLEADEGEDAASTAYAIATGQVTPFAYYVPAWLAEGGSRGPVKERTKAQYRGDVSGVEAWLLSVGVAPTVEAVTKRVAGRYVSEGLVSKGVDWKTANRKISAVSAYWRWLVKRGVVDTNPWIGQSLPKVSTGGRDTEPRAFTDSEMVVLLNGAAGSELHDAMRVAALSGMRIEEIYRLTAADCADGWFKVRQAKTKAGIRRVPIHSGLAETVARRIKDKPAGAFLFPEPGGAAKPGRERSMAVSKRFGHYRKRVGVDDKAEGRRQSRTTFHSFRRWFVTQARGGNDLAVVQAVIGHDSGNLTDDVYSAGPSDAARRACVELVALPTAGAQGAA